jgi:hypothetical protein
VAARPNANIGKEQLRLSRFTDHRSLLNSTINVSRSFGSSGASVSLVLAERNEIPNLMAISSLRFTPK